MARVHQVWSCPGLQRSSNVRRERFKTHKGHQKGGLNHVEPEMPCESATVDVAFGIFWQERYGKMLSLGPRRLHKR